MAFSLSNWFKGKPGQPGSGNPDETPSAESQPATPAAPPAPQISSAVRKVVPNSVQPVSLRSNISGARPLPVQLPVSAPPALAMASQPGRVSPIIPPARGKIAFGTSSDSAEAAAPELSSAVVPDVTVSLVVGDFIDRIPPGYVSPTFVDRQRQVDFRATELYSDLTKGRASVPASVIYQKCPELFSRPVTDELDTEVQLPLQKLVEQMSQAFQTRPDQVAEDNVGEIETPFLQVAMEDSARLPKAAGTTAGALRSVNPPAVVPSPLNEPPRRPHRTGQISTISVPKVAPEPAPALAQAAPSASTVVPINAAKRPPSTVRASVAGGKIRLSGPSVPNRMVPVSVPPPVGAPGTPAPEPELPPSASQRILPPLQVPGSAPAASPSHQVSKKTARIQIPPISLRGAGGASRQAAPVAVPVQASPVPVRPGPHAEPSAPPITFRSSPPPASAKPMPHSFAPPAPRPAVPPPAFPASPAPAAMIPPPAPAPAMDERKISLSLSAILRGLPMSSLTVDPNNVPDDVRIRLPFALVEPQLAQGRVVVSNAAFAAALPESHREALASNSGLSEIPLPLQEVFQNLPPAALSIRHDQVTEEVGMAYPTPFSQKAEEDAARLASNSDKKTAPAAEASVPITAEVNTTQEPAFSLQPTDHPLPVDRTEEEKVPEPPAPIPFTTERAHEEEDVPSEEFANLFVEEPAPALSRDIPIEPDAESPLSQADSPIMAPVEAKASVEEKLEPAVEDKREPAVEAKDPAANEEPKPTEAAVPEPEAKVAEKPADAVTDAKAEEKPADLVAEPQIEAKTDEPKPEVSAVSQAEPRVADEPTPVFEDKRAEPAKSLEPEPTTAVERKEPKPAEASHPLWSPAEVKLHDSALQTLFMTEEELDAKTIVRLVTALPGIVGCAVMFEDGLQLAGNFPSESDAEGFSAMAPPFFKRARNFTGEINLGTLHAFTLYTGSELVSFFMQEPVCLSVRHTGRGFLPGVREKLEIVTRELARMYSSETQPH